MLRIFMDNQFYNYNTRIHLFATYYSNYCFNRKQLLKYLFRTYFTIINAAIGRNTVMQITWPNDFTLGILLTIKQGVKFCHVNYTIFWMFFLLSRSSFFCRNNNNNQFKKVTVLLILKTKFFSTKNLKVFIINIFYVNFYVICIILIINNELTYFFNTF